MSRQRQPALPLEIQTIIIDMIAEDLHTFGTVESSRLTLSTCTLVCHTWCNRCHKHLFKLVILRRIRHLEALASASSVHTYVTGVATHEEHLEKPFVHLVPRVLSTRLLHLQNLSLGGYASKLIVAETNHEDSHKRTFHYHASFPLYLAQFSALRAFTLLNFRFASFLDIRRIVGALPSLSSLFMTKVTWEQQKSAGFSLLHATKWGVSKVTMWDCQLDVLGLWFWLHPPVRAPERSYEGLKDQSHPAFLVYDAIAIRSIMEEMNVQNRRTPHVYMDFEWKYVSQRSHWELKCSAGGTYTIDSVFTIDGVPPHTESKYLSVASVKAVQFLLPLYVNWKQIPWSEVDSTLGSFSSLMAVVLVIPWLVGDGTAQWSIANQLGLSWSVSDRIGTPDAYGDVTQAIRGYLPSTNERCDLRIVYEAHQFNGSKYTI